jgi:epoxyqueuosine reductase
MPDDVLSLGALTCFIESVVQRSPLNRLVHIDGSPMFGQPLIGVADGDDPLFEQYKTIIGPHHLMPRAFLAPAATAPCGLQPSDPVRVLCWVLPISAQTRHSNAVATTEPSMRWAHTRYYGEMFNDELRHEVKRYVSERGAIAVDPATSPLSRTIRGIQGGPSSTWSERHALYAAGLGTFGLCGGFLTPAGKAMRCGSVVVNLPLPVSPRRHTSHTAACAYLDHGACGDCMRRCPAHAIGPAGHNKGACQRYQDVALRHLRESYGVPVTGCGLCQTGVPCESCLPDSSG